MAHAGVKGAQIGPHGPEEGIMWTNIGLFMLGWLLIGLLVGIVVGKWMAAGRGATLPCLKCGRCEDRCVCGELEST